MSASRIAISVIGPQGAGTTSFLKRLREPDWKWENKQCTRTRVATDTTWTGQDFTVTFWDVPVSIVLERKAEENLRRLLANSVILLVWDLSQELDAGYFARLNNRLRDLQNTHRMYIVGTKLDLAKEGTEKNLKTLAGQYGFGYLGTCSAKTGNGIENCKARLSDEIKSIQVTRNRQANFDDHAARGTRASGWAPSCAVSLEASFFGGIVYMASMAAQQTTAQAITFHALNFAIGFGATLAIQLILFMLIVRWGCCCSPPDDFSPMFSR